jgi:glycine hydroxymethyltransferase
LRKLVPVLAGWNEKNVNFQKTIAKYVSSRSDCIPLVASENAMSAAVKALCGSEVAERYCVGKEAPWKYPRESLLEEMISETGRLACDIFGGKSCTVAPLSGSQCVAAIMLGICKPGDLVIGLGSDDGGHWALSSMAKAQRCDFKAIPLKAKSSVNAAQLQKMAKGKPLALVMVDPSHSIAAIQPESLRRIIPNSVPLFYDLSHFMGIVPHEYLKDPLKRGVTAIHGSTHKSFFGPQKGMIVFGELAGDDLINRICHAAETVLTSNCHLHHVAALGMALQEYKMFGKEYAGTTVSHARTFARVLVENGLDVITTGKEATNSHQVLLRLDSKAKDVWDRLTAIGILCNLIRLPMEDTLGIRFGLAEIARRGYTNAEVRQAAQAVADAVKESADRIAIEKRIKTLARKPRSMKFCFTNPSPRA